MSFVEDATLVNKGHFTIDDEQAFTKNVELLKSLDNKIIGLYFSAAWCPPCRLFTPVLCSFYEEQVRKNNPFEIVFVSFDQTAEDMQTYYTRSHGDWLAVKFGDPAIEKLKTTYGIESVPKLIITTINGSVISDKGRKEVQDRGGTCFSTWKSSSLLHKSNIATGKPNIDDTITLM